MPQGHYGFPNIVQLVRTTSLKVLGKPGATAGAGLAGGTTSGAPTTGQFDAGDAVVAQNGHLWICTVSGTPGTWVDAGASGAYTDPLTTRGDLVVRGAASTGRLALGTSGYILTSDGTDAAWAAAGAGFSDPLTTRGDLIVRGGSGTTRLALGSSGQYLKSDGTDAAWAVPSLSTVSNLLGADVTMSAANTFYDGPSVSCAAGTWLLTGAVYVYDPSVQSNLQVKLWDGTTVATSGEAAQPFTFQGIQLALSAIVAPGSTTTYKISACCGSSTSAKIRAATTHNGSGNNASFLYGVRIA